MSKSLKRKGFTKSNLIKKMESVDEILRFIDQVIIGLLVHKNVITQDEISEFMTIGTLRKTKKRSIYGTLKRFYKAAFKSIATFIRGKFKRLFKGREENKGETGVEASS